MYYFKSHPNQIIPLLYHTSHYLISYYSITNIQIFVAVYCVENITFIKKLINQNKKIIMIFLVKQIIKFLVNFFISGYVKNFQLIKLIKNV